MGYCMNQYETKFFINKKDFPQVIEAIKDMWNYPERMGGGSSNGESWYAWCDNPTKETEIDKVLTCMRWEPVFDLDGNINDIIFDGEKLGDDEQLFRAIAPHIKDGSYIVMVGEDDFNWAWVFKNGTCKENSLDRKVILEHLLSN